MKNQFNFIRIHNPLEPTDNSRELRDFVAGESMLDLFPAVMGMNAMGYTVNGGVVDVEDMGTTLVQAGDYVTQCPVLQGGDGAKSVLRIVAMIAIAVYAPYLAAELGYAMGGGMFIGSTTGLAMMEVGIMVAGSVLVNSLLPPPKIDAGGSSASESPTYGADGAKNTSAEGLPVPVPYGQHRMGGNILSNYVVNDGNTQWLYMLLCAGEGEVGQILQSSVLVNGLPLSNYVVEAVAGVSPRFEPEFEFRPGAPNDPAPKWFSQPINPNSVNKKLTTDYFSSETNGAVDRIRLDFVAPSGMYIIDDRGNTQTSNVTISAQYRPWIEGANAGAWSEFGSVHDVTSYGTRNVFDQVVALDEWGYETSRTNYVPTGNEVVSGETIWSDSRIGGGESGSANIVGRVESYPIYSQSGEMAMGGAQRTAIRRSFLSPTLPEAKYEVRYKRLTAEDTSSTSKRFDAIILSDIVGMLDEKVGYLNTATVAVKLRLSDHLTSIPTVTYLSGGKIINVWDGSQWRRKPSSNPAWITADILCNSRYGGGASTLRLDLERFKDWAAWCDKNGLEFHGIFDTAGNVWEAANQASRCGRAQVIMVGTRYSVLIERAEEPSMLFSVANMISGTFNETWLSMSDRANEIEVSYADQLDSYAQRTIRVIDGDLQNSGTPQRKSTVQLMGIVDAQRAYDEGTLALKLNRYIRRTVKFSAPIDAIACAVGDVILVQHDMPKWGEGGMLETGSTGSLLKLDRKVTLEYGKTYQALVHMDVMQRAAGTVISILGDTVMLGGYTGSTAVKRLLVAGKDVEVMSIEQVGANYGVRLDSAGGITPGMSYQLCDTNALVTRTVQNTAPVGGFVEVDALTLTSSIGASPHEYSKWTFGETSKATKPFRVKAISGSHEYRRDITAIEYNASIYNKGGTVEDLNHSSLSDAQVRAVLIDGVSEELILVGATYQSQVTVGYHSEQASYLEAEVFLSRNGGQFMSLGRDKSGVSVVGFKGEVLEFRVVAIDRNGKSASIANSPSVTHAVIGRAERPNAAIGFTGAFSANGISYTWDRPREPDWNNTELRLGSSWAAGVPFFSERLTNAVLPWRTATGAFKAWARHSIPGIEATEDRSVSLTTLPPGVPSITSTATATGTVTFSWQDCKASQPIAKHTMRIGNVGSTWESLSDFATISSTGLSHAVAFGMSGVYWVWIAATDLGGIQGSPSHIEVTATAVADASVSMTSSSPVFRSDSDGSNASPSLITFTATPTGRIAGVTPTWSTDPAGVPLGVVSKDIRTLTSANMGALDTIRIFASYADGTDSFNVTATIVKIKDGVVGAIGDKTAAATLYMWSSVMPGLPTQTGTYNWSTGGVEAYSDGVGWSNKVETNPGIAGIRLWTAVKPLVVAGGAFNTSVSWTTGAQVSAVSMNGLTGPDGNKGDKGDDGIAGAHSGKASVYRWDTSIPAPPSGTSTYTWSTASVSPIPSNWLASAGSSVSPGMTLYEASVNLLDSASNSTTGVNWTSASIHAIGYAAVGEAGERGASVRIAYAKITGQSVASNPDTVTTSGGISYPGTGAWGAGEVWGASVPAIAANESVMQTVGIWGHTADTTVWGHPFLSALKVGSLSAISANFGHMTSGSMDINGQFTVSAAGDVEARSIIIRKANGAIVLNAGATKPIPASVVEADSGWLNTNVKVGGRNILRSSNIFGVVTSDKFGGNNAQYFDIAVGGNQRVQGWTTHEPDHYSVSFWAKATAAITLEIDLCDVAFGYAVITTGYQLFKFEGLYVNSIHLNGYGGFLDFGNPSTTSRVTISNLKIETGTKCTDWSPAPEDVAEATAAAQLTASNAATAASNANTQIGYISDDNVLTRSEKPELIKQWDAIAGEWNRIQAQANERGVSTTAMGAAYTVLSNYLLSMRNTNGGGNTSSWSDTSSDCTINGATLRANFLGYTNARQDVLNAIASAAAKTSTWVGTSSKPTDSELLNSYVKVGGRNILKGASTGAGWSYTNRSGTEFWVSAAATGETDYIYSPYITIPGNVEVTLTFESKQDGPVSTTPDWFLLPDNHAAWGLSSLPYTATTEYAKNSFVFVTPPGWGLGANVRLRIDHNGSPNATLRTYYARNIKLEYGNKATDWMPPVEDVAEATAAAQLTASNAASAASTAQGAANTANNLLADIASDSKVTPVELALALNEWKKANNEYDGIAASPSESGTAGYVAAFTALSQYLNGPFTRGIPICFVNMAATIGIVNADWNAAWNNYYAARQVLLNAVAAYAAKTSTWALTNGAGKPADNASRVVDLGDGGHFGARNRSDTPSEYASRGAVRHQQFKHSSSVGLTGATLYCTLETLTQYTDSSGGRLIQYAYADAKTFRRNGDIANNTWSAWVIDLDRNSYTGDLNATANQSDAAALQAAAAAVQARIDLNQIIGAAKLDGVITATEQKAIDVAVSKANDAQNAAIAASGGVALMPLGTGVVKGTTVTKVGGPGTWDSGAYSKDGFSAGCFASATIPVVGYDIMFGLNSFPASSGGYDDIPRCWYFTGGSAYVRVDNNHPVSPVGYSAGDVFAIKFDGVSTSFYRNGTRVHWMADSLSATLYFDSTIVQSGASITNIQFGPVSSNDWSATGGAGKPEDNANRTTNTNQLIDGSNLGGTANYGNLSGTPSTAIANSSITVNANGTLSGAGSGQVQNLPVVDNDRYTNRPPSFYAPSGAGYRISEFKSAPSFGLPGTWCTVETIGQWSAGSGAGYIVQYGYCGTQTYRRNANDANAWSAWVQDLDRNAYTGDLNATAGAVWNSSISGQPADASIHNNQIGINASGQLYGIGGGVNTVVSNGQLSVSADGILYNAGTAQGQVTRTPITDTDRYTNFPPSAYGTGTTREFKHSASMGLPEAYGAWCTLETIKQYPQNNGGYPGYQYGYIGERTYRRRSVDDAGSGWSGWVVDLDTAAYTGALNATNGATIGTNVFGQINSTNVDALIAPKGLNTSHINATSLSALTATIGILETATWGSRVRIEDNLIRVFDGSNNVRVRISS